MRGAATQAISVYIVEVRQRSRCPPAAAPLRAAARRPAGFVARSSHTTPGMLVARASPAGLGASSKVGLLFCHRPQVSLSRQSEPGAVAPGYFARYPPATAGGSVTQPMRRFGELGYDADHLEEEPK